MSQPPDNSDVWEGRPPLPSRREARQLLEALAVFWVAWASAVAGFVLLERPAFGVVAAVVAVSAFAAFCARLLGVLGGAQGVQSWVRIDGRWLKGAVQASGWPTRTVWAAVVLLVTLDVMIFVLGFLAWTAT